LVGMAWVLWVLSGVGWALAHLQSLRMARGVARQSYDPDDRDLGLAYEATPCVNESEGGPRPTLRDIATRYLDETEGGLKPTLREDGVIVSSSP